VLWQSTPSGDVRSLHVRYVPSGGIKLLEVKICPEAGKGMFRPGLEDREVPDMRSPTTPLYVAIPLDYMYPPPWFIAMHHFLKTVQYCVRT